MPTRQDAIDDLSDKQLAMIEDVIRAKQMKDTSMENYARMLTRCIDRGGVSYGVLQEKIGVAREAIWKTVKRYRERQQGMRTVTEKRS